MICFLYDEAFEFDNLNRITDLCKLLAPGSGKEGGGGDCKCLLGERDYKGGL